MKSTWGHWPLSRAEHWEMDQQGHIKHSSSGVNYHFDNADNAVDDIQVMAMIKFCYRPLPRWRRTVQCTLPPPGRTVHLHWCYLAGSYCFFFANMADHLLIKSFWWSSCHILWIGTHLLRNGTSWARLLWTDTRVAASISRETFSHSSLHSALSQGPWWRPSEFVRATPFLRFFSIVICDICCPVIANSDVALERMFGLSPATSPATTSNGSSTKTT